MSRKCWHLKFMSETRKLLFQYPDSKCQLKDLWTHAFLCRSEQRVPFAFTLKLMATWLLWKLLDSCIVRWRLLLEAEWRNTSDTVTNGIK
jgi:hypothetical protein